jgi:hypothetical protein
MHVLPILVILIALLPALVNMSRLTVTIIMTVLMTHAALSRDVSTLTIPTNVLLQINVTMLSATQLKDALSLITLTAAQIPTNVTILLVIQIMDVFTPRSLVTMTICALMTPATLIMDVSILLLLIPTLINVLRSTATVILEYTTQTLTAMITTHVPTTTVTVPWDVLM